MPNRLQQALQQCGMDPTHEWELVCINHDQVSLTVVFRGASPTVGEIAALRRVAPECQDKPASEVAAAIGKLPQLNLGIRSGMEARRLIKKAETQDLKIIAKDASITNYQPRDRTARQVLLIEDEKEAQQIATILIEAGIRVVPVESD